MMHVSLLSSYLYCPRKVFLEKVLKLVEPPKAVVIKGTIRHRAHELINEAEQSLVSGLVREQTPQEIHDTYNRRYSSILRKVIFENVEKLRQARLEPGTVHKSLFRVLQAEARHRSKNVFEFMDENKVYGDELWQMLTPKIKSEYRISSEKLQMSGVVDELEVYEDKLVPIELKTGRAPKEGVWPGHQLQVAAYVLLLEERFSTILHKGVIRYLEGDVVREVVMNPFLREKVDDTRNKILKLFEEKSIPPIVTNENKCKACGLRKECHDDSFIAEKLDNFNRKL